MPVLSLGNKIRQFKQLSVLQQRRIARSNDPYSAYQRDAHRAALHLVTEILKQGWSYLLLERQFLEDKRTYTQFFTKNKVVGQLLAALEAYEKCLTHQAADPSRVRYDFTAFERSLSGAINAVQSSGQIIRYEAVERPKTSWKCFSEYEGWKVNWRDMVNPMKGKLRVKESEFPDVARLVDGDITVSLIDEKGLDWGEYPLMDTLPKELVRSFDEDFKRASDARRPMDSGFAKTMAEVVPQGRTEFSFRPKPEKAMNIGIEDETTSDELVVVKKRSSMRLTVRCKQAEAQHD